MLNVFFMIVNIPLVFFILFIGITKIFTYLPLFLICSIPVGPSFAVLLYCTGKLVRQRDKNVFSDILKGVKLNFIQALIIWIIQLIIAFILYVNLSFFAQSNFIVFCLFACLGVVFLFITPYIYLIISRFSMKLFAILRVSIILVFTKPIITITNILVFAFVLILFEISPGTTVVFISSIATFLISYATKKLIKDLEESSKSILSP